MKTDARRNRGPVISLARVLVLGCVLLAPLAPLAAEAGNNPVTFAKDVVPIFQEKCQACHRPGSVAPMSLLTYEETRPWARSIKNRVSLREMPPWHLDKTVGIQRFKNDRSLSDEEIDTIVRWIDAGAPLGNPKDLPPPIQWPDDDSWTIGTPDLIVNSPEHVMYANGADWWVDHIVDTGLTEDRYIKAIETKPSKQGRRIVHHAVTSIIDEENPEGYLSEYAVGKYGDIFADGTGRLLTAGSQLKFNMHYFAIGEEVRDVTSVAFVFYPRGYVPKHLVKPINIGTMGRQGLYKELDIPPHTVTRHDGFLRLPKPARLLSYQPHMHMRGKAMTMEAIYPDNTVEVLSAVDRFDFNWHVAYVYEDDVTPLLPAGTVLHTIGIHDNTAANKRNPDPTIWVGTGMRSIDDMLQCHVLLVYLEDEEFERLVEERKAKLKLSEEN